MKKYLAFALCLIMVFSLLAGCAKEEAAPVEDSAPPTVSEADAAEEPSALPAEESEQPAGESVEPAEEAPKYEKVSYELPLFDEEKSFTVFYALRGGAAGNSFPNRDDLEFWQTTQEKLNVDLEFQEPGESVATEKYNLMCASGDLTDLICENMLAMNGSAYTGGYDRAIADDVYIDLMEYVEQYAPNYAYYILGNEDNRKNAITDEGHLATFLQVYSEKQLNNMGCVVNKKHLADTGLEAPDSVESWLEAYAAMADNGVKYPVEANSSGAIMQGAFAQAMGASITTGFVISAETEEFVFCPTTDETRQYIELFMDLNKKGWMHPDWMNISGMDRTYFNNGEVSTRNMMINEIGIYEAKYGVAVEALPVVHREGFDGNKTAMGSLGQALVSSAGGFAVSTACQDVESAMKFLDFFYSDEGADAANLGWEEGVLYNVVDGKKVASEKYQQKNENDMEYKNFLTHDGDFALCYPNIRYDIATDDEKKMYDMWKADTTNEAAIYFSLPQAIALTSEESENITSAFTDLETYVESTVFSWLALDVQLTDAAWEDFTATCQSMRLDEIKQTYEAAYQRYLEK